MTRNIEALWDRLVRAGVATGAFPAGTEVQPPWYVRVMLGVSGWIAALFLLGFVAIGLEFIIDSATASVFVGALALAAAFVLFRLASNDFYQQFALAVSFAGQGLVLFGLFDAIGWRGSGVWWAAALLQIVVAVVMPNFVQRLVAAFVAAYALSVAMIFHGATAVVPVLATLGIAVIWLKEFHWQRLSAVMRPIGYGLTLALVQLEGQALFGRSLRLFGGRSESIPLFFPHWLGELVLGLLFVAVVGRLLAQRGEACTSPRMLVALGMAAVIAAASLEAPGIATGFVIILLGFSNGNRLLVGLGVAALLFYVSAYYYSLETTLLVKSQILAATGALLLAVRWVVLKWVFPAGEGRHA
ncbi:MAG: DUF4401 domain-containing protein [Gammaproteobacteria bacterium]